MYKNKTGKDGEEKEREISVMNEVRFHTNQISKWIVMN